LTQISREWYANSEFRSHQVVVHVGRWGLRNDFKKLELPLKIVYQMELNDEKSIIYQTPITNDGCAVAQSAAGWAPGAHRPEWLPDVGSCAVCRW